MADLRYLRRQVSMLGVLALAGMLSCAYAPQSAAPDDIASGPPSAPSAAPAMSHGARVAHASSRPAPTCHEVVIRLPASIAFHGDGGTVSGAVQTSLPAGTYEIRHDARSKRFVVHPWGSTKQVLHVMIRGQRALYQAYLASMSGKPIPLRVEGAGGAGSAGSATSSSGTASTAGASCSGCSRVDGIGAAEAMRLIEAAGAGERERAWAGLVKGLAGRTLSADDVRKTLAEHRRRLGVPDAPARTAHEAVSTATAEAWAALPESQRAFWRDYLRTYGHTADVTNAEGLRITTAVRLSMALRMVPRFVKPGARDAWEALVNDPVFQAATAVGITAYFALWMSPDIVISKAAAIITTIGVMSLVGCSAAEIVGLARAWMRLRDEAARARTLAELERAAERFGNALGGSALRILLALSTAVSGKVLPVARVRPMAPGGMAAAGAGGGPVVIGGATAARALEVLQSGAVVLAAAPMAMATLGSSKAENVGGPEARTLQAREDKASAPGAGKGFTGGTSKTITNVKIGKQQVRVDVEYPTGRSIGNVHVQTKGAGGKSKYYLNSPADLEKLPASIRSTPEIQRAVKRAFDQLEKARR